MGKKIKSKNTKTKRIFSDPAKKRFNDIILIFHVIIVILKIEYSAGEMDQWVTGLNTEPDR